MFSHKITSVSKLTHGIAALCIIFVTGLILLSILVNFTQKTFSTLTERTVKKAHIAQFELRYKEASRLQQENVQQTLFFTSNQSQEAISNSLSDTIQVFAKELSSLSIKSLPATQIPLPIGNTIQQYKHRISISGSTEEVMTFLEVLPYEISYLQIMTKQMQQDQSYAEVIVELPYFISSEGNNDTA